MKSIAATNIAVYGQGHLGWPLSTVFAKAGYHVIGIDPKPSPMHNEGLSETVWKSKTPCPADFSFIVVPTPSFDDGSFNSNYVADCLEQINAVNEPGSIAVIVSTVSPGTCIKFEGLFPDLRIVYNPTFIAIGDVVKGLLEPDLLIVGASDTEAANNVFAVWAQVLPNHGQGVPPVCFGGDFVAAELIKLSVNAALGMKISLANSLGELFEAYGVDAKWVQTIGDDHRIGRDFLKPGGPITGPCLPRDNKALQEAAWRVGVTIPQTAATMEINEIFYSRLFKKIRGDSPTTVGFLGATYKYGTDVTTDSITEVMLQMLDQMPQPITTFVWDDILNAGDDPIRLTQVLNCDVIVCTQPEYRKHLAPYPKLRVIDVWSK